VTWLRRNRLGLILLPVALTLALAASSSRLVHFWLPYVASDVQKGTVGAPVHLEQEWIDHAGTHTRSVEVTIHGIDKTSVVRDFDGEDVESHGPTGTAVWRVSLSLAADADQVLRGCQLEVEDTEGRRYLFGSASTTPTDVKASPCLNPQEEGPEGDFFGTGPSTPDPEDRPRPAQWDTVADVILAGDAVPAKVRLWWEMPVVIIVPVTPTS